MPTQFFDIIIPVHKKDLAILEYAIKFAKKNIIGVRKIIVISKEKYTNNADWFDEAKFPFSLFEVQEKVGKTSAGWFFQQLLKLYSPIIIPEVSENVMILDSDTVFFKKTKMFDKKNRPFYNLSKDKNVEINDFDTKVEAHIQELLPEISRKNLPEKFQKFSGVAHNMIFNRKIIQELFQKVQDFHSNQKEFHEIFLSLAKNGHSVSEYQIYFNFCIIFHPDKIKIRKLKYKNTSDVDIKKYQKRFKYDYCSFHSYLRDEEKIEKKSIFKELFFIKQKNIGVVNCNISEFLTIPNQEIKWFESLKSGISRKNPFSIKIENQNFILFIKKNFFTKEKNISAIEIDENLKIINEKKIFTKNFSNFYIFKEENKNYCLISNKKTKEIILYEILKDLQFIKIKIILQNLEFKKIALTKYQNKFWLFFNISKNKEIQIANSEKIDGNYEIQEINPISLKIAGEIFSYSKNLFILAKNPKNSVAIQKIQELNENNLQITKEIEIHANQFDKFNKKIASISSFNENSTLICAEREIFYPFKIFRNYFKKM